LAQRSCADLRIADQEKRYVELSIMASKFKIPRGKIVPESWKVNSWEEKARENPLYAVMTVPELADADSKAFTEKQLHMFFSKGRGLYETHVKPLIELLSGGARNLLVVEYGCGLGRILKAVAADGHRCAGIDISQTMLDHCKALVPEMRDLYLLGSDGRCGLPGDSADIVYSYAVLQHIDKLSRYLLAVDEMCRLLKPGGILALQVNCEDFVGGLDALDRTDNFEDYSLHYRHNESAPYARHQQTTWSGVYIGEGLLKKELAERGCEILKIYYHNPIKLRAIWLVARKKSSESLP
jgi:SAM-dependent methyltransferase